MNRAEVESFVEPVKHHLSQPILDAFDKVTRIDPGIMRSLTSLTKSNLLRDHVVQCCRDLYSNHSEASVEEINDNVGILFSGANLFLRPKKLDKKMRPMNISTDQQKWICRTGIFEGLNVSSPEILILGYRYDSAFTHITDITLFPNQFFTRPQWYIKLYDINDADRIDLFDENSFSVKLPQEPQYDALPFTIRSKVSIGDKQAS